MIPLSDRILIQRIGDVEKIGSIYLPDCAKTRSYKGVVLAVGPGKWDEAGWWKIKGEWKWFDAERVPMDVHPGQTVMFSSQWNDFTDADYEGKLPLERDEQIHLVRQADIIGIVPDA
jgi:chaperonin GroES